MFFVEISQLKSCCNKTERLYDALINLFVTVTDYFLNNSSHYYSNYSKEHFLSSEQVEPKVKLMNTFITMSFLHGQVGSFLLSVVASVAHGQLKPHMSSLLVMCTKMLNETENHRVAFHTLQ
jgi:hypothetical protein